MSWITSQPIAHRGLHTEHRPENSLGAITAAVADGYAIEVDVRLTADGVPVCFHDRTLDRLTNASGPLSNRTWDELRELRLLDSDERIPRLSDTLSLINGEVPVLLEIKNPGRTGTLEKSITSQLDEYDGEFAVQSFNPLSIGWFRRHRPDWPRGQLAGFFEGESSISIPQRLFLKRLLGNWYSQPDFIGYEHERLPYQPVMRRRKMGLPVLAWTVRTRDDLQRVSNYADNVIFEGIRP